MTFLVFDALAGGNLLWSEVQSNVMVENGIYKVNLGGSEPIDFASFNARDTYLEVRVFGETLGPRKRIVSVPFALKAEGEVPEGAMVLGEVSGDPAITGLGYTEQGDTIGPYYLYQKDAYNPSQSRVPRRIAYQGKVGPVDGGTVGATADFAFTIFDAGTGGAAVWSETQDDVPVDASGLFSVELGKNNPVDPDDLVSKDLWLSVSVNGQALSPREKFASAAYALKVISPAPEGAVVLAASNTNSDLISKKFALIAGATVDGYYPYRKSAFNPSDPSVPLLINYQGKLTDVAGDTLSADTVDIGFRIFDGATAGALLWSETVLEVGLSAGIFNALLGGGSTISPATFPGPDAWIEIIVVEGTTIETLFPRQRLASVPFAMSAEGTLPTSALILSSAADSDTLTSSGYQPTGDTVSGYYIYAKTDIDTTPPDLSIITPAVYSGSSVAATTVLVIYSDSLSGIDTGSFQAFLNGSTVSSSFTVSGATATATLTASLGMNILKTSISDLAGNSRQKLSYFYMDNTGTPPVINITSPLDGTSVGTNTPLIEVEFYDDEGGIDLASLAIEINGVDRTDRFIIETAGSVTRASWRPDAPLPLGANVACAWLRNLVGWLSGDTSQFDVVDGNTGLRIDSISPQFGFAGDTVTITGNLFSANTVENAVYFAPQKRARVWQASPSQLIVTAPKGAISGYIMVVVNNRAAVSTEAFVLGLPYGFVVNYDNAYFATGGPSVAVIDFDSSPGDVLNYITVTDFRPYDVAVSPDGRLAYVTDIANVQVHVIDAAIADSATADRSVLKSIDLLGLPRYLELSPDGLELYLGTDLGQLVIMRNHQYVMEHLFLPEDIEPNKIDASVLTQHAYFTLSNMSTPETATGEVHSLNIDRSSPNYLLDSQLYTIYRHQMGVTTKPTNDEVYEANNNANGASDAFSFSIFDAGTGAFKRTQGASIPPIDTHDVGHPYDVLFDPRGQLFYVSFSGGGPPTGTITYNVGVQRWPATSGNFQAGTTQATTTPAENPHGLAVSPGGEWVFSANFGLNTGAGNQLMIFDHDQVKTAIDVDPGTTTYNLSTNTPVIALDSTKVKGLYPGIVQTKGGFDGPWEVAFQEFPVIDINPNIVHMAIGGVAPEVNIVRAQVHPVYGDTVKVGLTNGSSLELGPASMIDVVFHPQWLGQDRDIFATTDVYANNVTLVPSSGDTGGVGKLIAETNGYPSNVAFITVPPQNIIQMLVGELAIDRTDNRITQMALISVVKNRLRLPDSVDHDQNGSYVRYNFPGSQVRADNAGELYVSQQMKNSITCGQYSTACIEGNTTVGEWRYWRAASRQKLLTDYQAHPNLLQFMNAYDQAVRYAGMVQLDLLRTGMDLDLLPDPTIARRPPGTLPEDGCFSFYSPTEEQWEENTNDPLVSIQEALISETTQFPQAGNSIVDHKERLERDIVCGGAAMLSNLCVGTPPNKMATYIQIVIPPGISTYPLGQPDFIFFRLRQANEPSVVPGITVEAL